MMFQILGVQTGKFFFIYLWGTLIIHWTVDFLFNGVIILLINGRDTFLYKSSFFLWEGVFLWKDVLERYYESI